MKVYMHYPATKEKKAALQGEAARIHGQAVIRYLQALPCPNDQKIALLNAVLAQKG